MKYTNLDWQMDEESEEKGNPLEWIINKTSENRNTLEKKSSKRYKR